MSDDRMKRMSVRWQPSLADAAARALEGAGPLDAGEILARIESLGLRSVSGDDPVSRVYGALCAAAEAGDLRIRRIGLQQFEHTGTNSSEDAGMGWTDGLTRSPAFAGNAGGVAPSPLGLDGQAGFWPSAPESLTWQAFERLAATALRRLGFSDAQVTAGGSDGGVDIRSREVLAQVKARTALTGRPDVQRLHGIARAESKLGVFFSVSGYTSQAIEWAELAPVALFLLDASGAARAVGGMAQRMVDEAARRMPSLPAEADDAEDSFGAMLAAGGENVLVHLPSGPDAPAQGLALARLMASISGKPLRVISPGEVGSGGQIPISVFQNLSPGQVVHLDRVERYPDVHLKMLLMAFSGRLDLRIASGTSWSMNADLVVQHLTDAVGAWVDGQREDDPASWQPPAVLLIGRSGYSQEALIMELNKSIQPEVRWVDAVRLWRTGDLAGLLTDLDDGSVLAIGNVDQLSDDLQAVLRTAVVERKLDVLVGEGQEARTVRLDLPAFFLVGATSDSMRLSSDMRAAFADAIEVEEVPGAVESTVRGVWTERGLAFVDEALRAVALVAGASRRLAFHLAHHVADRRSGETEPLQGDQAASDAAQLAAQWEHFRERDWLLMDWARGAAHTSPWQLPDNRMSGQSILPPVTIVGTTQIPWSPQRDLRSAFGDYGQVFASVLVLPETVSDNVATLRYELADIPLIR